MAGVQIRVAALVDVSARVSTVTSPPSVALAVIRVLIARRARGAVVTVVATVAVATFKAAVGVAARRVVIAAACTKLALVNINT
jgi:hypothetical protein